jgi:putative ABC transport system permease protein
MKFNRLRRGRREDELEAEIHQHLDQAIHDRVEHGESPDEARANALREFGNVGLVKEVTRETWGWTWLDRIRQDLRFGARMLAKNPGFTLMTALTLALGIGATSAVFSLIHGALLTPPPYANPERLALISPAWMDGRRSPPPDWSAAQSEEWRKETKSFESIAEYRWWFNYLVSEDGSEPIRGMKATKEYFHVFGLQPVVGRTFSDADHAVNSPPVIILGHNLWRRRFQGDPGVIGKTIRISRNETPVTVIGVMPPGVRFPWLSASMDSPIFDVNDWVDFWTPAPMDPNQRNDRSWCAIGRLRDDATLEQAQAELDAMVARQRLADRESPDVRPNVQSLMVESNHDGRRILLPLLGASALVLLIACGNAAALLLVRGFGRRREYAVRSALGASRGALFRQVCMEGLLLSSLGGAFGVGLAFGVVKLFKLVGAAAIPRLDAVTIGWPSLAFGFAAAVLATLLAELLPALQACRPDPMDVLKAAGPKSSAGRGERRLLRGVAMAQTALTLALLVGAALLIRTMMNLANVETGYNADRILTMTVTPVRGEWDAFNLQTLERVSAIPGVQQAAFAWGAPLTGHNWLNVIDIEGQPTPAKPSDRPTIPTRSVSQDYFQLLGLSVTSGRSFRSSDDDHAPRVAIVNQAFVDRYFLQTNPIGKKIQFPGRPKFMEIIGVVNNSVTDDLTKAATPELYLSFWQSSAWFKHILVRTAADPRAVTATLQRELRAVDPTVALGELKTLEQIREDSQPARRFAMQLLIGFAVTALALALIGVYGVLSLSVANRTQEIAIRTAVGAEPRDILRMVLGDGLRLILGGVTLGLTVAVFLSRFLTAFLFGVKPTDPVILLGVGVLFVCIALPACWLPARRATRVDPLAALRSE